VDVRPAVGWQILALNRILGKLEAGMGAMPMDEAISL
jgi:hypothetical protein